MRLAEKIIASHAGRESVRVGEILQVRVDRIYVHDGNSPTIAKIFDKYGFTSVFDSSRIAVFHDHSVLPPDVAIADRLRESEAFCEKFSLESFRAGEGISHIVALETGWFQPGSIILGSDSHTCTGGVVQSLALGMGASDIAAAMVLGETWLRVPESVCVSAEGFPGRHTRSKDVLLYALSRFGEMTFLYRSIEWSGPWVESLALNYAATIANMAVEFGAKCAFLPPGEGRPTGLEPLGLDEDEYAEYFHLDVEGLPPFIAKPHAPTNAVPIDECRGQDINYVFVGSCTNGHLEDVAEVARVLEGQRVRRGVHMVVTPASKSIYLEAMRRGYIETILTAGAVVTPPGCGSCLGTQGPIPATGDRVLSTMNRNFLGRMGNRNAEIYLASPLVAAHTALRGEVPGESDLA
ncbi:MAG TPA: aconitase/3-isopropylmalate dehydratase large subunit family protein [Pyrinomonadaceae bacterium]